MFRITTIVALFSLVASSLLAATPAEARTLNDVRREGAQAAHAAAARATAAAGSIQARMAAETARFNVAMGSSNQNTRFYAKRAFIGYLNSLKSALGRADWAHVQAIRAFQAYYQTSKNPAALGTINALSGARSRFAVAISQVDARITMVAAMK